MSRCDGASAFTSDVMRAFHDIMGVKHVDVSAPDDPTHHALVEHRNQVMEKMLDVGDSNGDVNSADDLHMYCAAATAVCNLEYIYQGHTVLEYLTGEVPRTHRDMVLPASIPDILGDVDSDFLVKLRTVLTESNALLQFSRDDDARYNALSRDATQTSRVATQFTLKPGDQVSYAGELHVLLRLADSPPSMPAKAVVRNVSHDGVAEKTVLYSDLRPLASPRPVHLYSSPRPVACGDFVFFTFDDSPHVRGGVVSEVMANGSFGVHEYRQSPKRKRLFQPLYFNSISNSYDVKRKPSHHSYQLHGVADRVSIYV